MKTISVPTDWLNDIDGLSVEDAIAYLKDLPQDYRLNYWQSSGDDHGVEISSELTYQRPHTEQELAELAAKRKAREIAQVKFSIKYYADALNRFGLDSYQYKQAIERLKQLQEDTK